MSGFPALKPAFTIHVQIDRPIAVGSSSRGTPLVVVPISSGTLTNEPGFSPAIEADFVGTGNDYIHNDPTGKHMRLDAHVVLKTNDGASIYLNYTGIVDITPALSKILGGSADAATTEFGHSCSENYKELELGVYVAAGRFILDNVNPVFVEYKVSRVVKG